MCVSVSDDRFILKEMSRLEMQLFLGFAPNYFSYIQRCHTTQQPTLLGKIVGVYRIVYRNVTSNATLNSNLLVMENLFYSRSVTHKFDLKGSVRNRLVNPTAADNDGEIVLLDENLLKSMYALIARKTRHFYLDIKGRDGHKCEDS
jgi:1-phosphatidylinositol-3-phosphate 5-kinase